MSWMRRGRTGDRCPDMECLERRQMHMKVRRFRFYAKREDLQAILEEFQSKLDVYYVPTYSDEGPVFFKDAASLPDLGTNFFGSHQGNRQILAFSGTTACSWKEYRWRDHEKEGIRYTSLCDENIERIDPASLQPAEICGGAGTAILPPGDKRRKDRRAKGGRAALRGGKSF